MFEIRSDRVMAPWRGLSEKPVDDQCASQLRPGVVIECRNLFDLRKQALVDLLHVEAGERAGLGVGKDAQTGDSTEKQCSKSRSH